MSKAILVAVALGCVSCLTTQAMDKKPVYKTKYGRESRAPKRLIEQTNEKGKNIPPAKKARMEKENSLQSYRKIINNYRNALDENSLPLPSAPVQAIMPIRAIDISDADPVLAIIIIAETPQQSSGECNVPSIEDFHPNVIERLDLNKLLHIRTYALSHSSLRHDEIKYA